MTYEELDVLYGRLYRVTLMLHDITHAIDQCSAKEPELAERFFRKMVIEAYFSSEKIGTTILEKMQEMRPDNFWIGKPIGNVAGIAKLELKEQEADTDDTEDLLSQASCILHHILHDYSLPQRAQGEKMHHYLAQAKSWILDYRKHMGIEEE